MVKRAPKQAIDDTAQRCADAYIELAQLLEKEARRLKDYARGYRTGELLTMYTQLSTPEAIACSGHPAQRAIDALGNGLYDIRERCEALRAQLKGANDHAGD